MASTYSALKIQLMATGENSGTWGNVTNDNLGVAIEEAIAESADVTFSGSNVSITLSDTNASQTARNLRLNLTGTSVAATQALTVPDIEKPYIVNNGLTDDVEVMNSTGSNVTVPAGKTMWVYSTGAGVVNAMTAGENLTGLNASNVSSGTLSNARTTASSSNSASTIVARDASGNFAGNQITGVNVNASSQVTAVGFMRGKFSDDVVALEPLQQEQKQQTLRIFGSFLPRMAGPSTTAPFQLKTYIFNKGVFKWHLPLNNKLRFSSK
jgi:hypothetical protein